MKLKKILFALSLMAATMFTGCESDDPQIWADFTTDKDVYEVWEPVVIENKSTVKNAMLIACKWEWGEGEFKWGKKIDPLIFEEVGTYTITLTAICDADKLSNSISKTIVVQNSNQSPKADFTFSPSSNIRSGDEIQFTDASVDPDGSIESWEWRFGTTVVTDQNPKFTFAEYGKMTVSLKVTDDKRGTDTKTIEIDVAKGPNNIDLAWECEYDTATDGYVYFGSPAISRDGNSIYVMSSSYQLASVSASGRKEWTFDGTVHGATSINSSGNKLSASCTPCVDEDGTIYLGLGFNQGKIADNPSGMFAVSPNGTQKWYYEFGYALFRFCVPAVSGDYVIFTTKENPSGTQNFIVIDKNAGTPTTPWVGIKTGALGGVVAMQDGKIIANTGGKYGTRVYFPNGAGLWKFNGSANGSAYTFGYYDNAGKATFEDPCGTQIAMDKNKKAYILFSTNTNAVDKESNPAVLYCYDAGNMAFDVTPTPLWVTGLPGSVINTAGLGVVCGEDGTVYATTTVSGDLKAKVFAINSSDGSIKWTAEADGDINGSAAVDNEGYIYYNDSSLGKLVKLNFTDGSKLSELSLGTELRSSPTIGPDGTIYVNGMKSNTPVLFAVKGSATAPADSWSQMGGSPYKTCNKY